MFGTQNLSLYLVSCVMLNLAPGQDTLFILGRSIAQGRKAGIVSVAGIMTGILIHTFLAAIGLSAVLATSALAFSIVKYAGAAYLIWIGIGLFRNGSTERSLKPDRETAQQSAWTVYRQGVLTNVLNPKVSLFFLSFLPQFVNPHTEYTFAPFFLLGMILFTTGSTWCMILACCSSWLTGRLRGPSSVGAWIKRLTGALFIGMAIKLALSRQGSVLNN